MKLILQRFSDNRRDTLGLLFKVDEVLERSPSFKCFTLEDEYREVKVKGETRIPAGFYELKIRKEETPLTKKYQERYTWFKFHIEVANVPGFQNVYIHIGNTDSDTDGCILLGDSSNNNVIGSGSIGNSTQATKRVYTEIYDQLDGGSKVHLEIRDERRLI